MADKDINDEAQWEAFVEKLASETRSGRITWQVDVANRDDAKGSVFFAEILKGKCVVVYRYTYTRRFQSIYHFGDDRITKHEDVAIELADENGEFLWQLPEVDARQDLIDVVEYKNAGADATLEAFLGSDA